MKKKCNSGGLMKIRLRKTLLVMKFLCFFISSKLFTECKVYSGIGKCCVDGCFFDYPEK